MSAAVALELEQAVVAKLRNGETAFEDLVTKLKEDEPNMDEVDVKAALWPLISRSVVELTPDGTLRLTT